VAIGREQPLAEWVPSSCQSNYERVAGRPYRFVWGNRDRGGNDFSSRLIKVDVTIGEARVWQAPGSYPGEPVLVRAPSAVTEDDGVVLSVVLDGRKANSFVLVLDGATLTELARTETPHHIPFHFHGNFIAHSDEWSARTTLHR
jgi:carotenoid cleavage dioxygenase-like enzyme